jgi:hypothetical protein
MEIIDGPDLPETTRRTLGKSGYWSGYRELSGRLPNKSQGRAVVPIPKSVPNRTDSHDEFD